VDSRNWWYSLIRTLHLRSVYSYKSALFLIEELNQGCVPGLRKNHRMKRELR
jgi:hypothetical protein